MMGRYTSEEVADILLDAGARNAAFALCEAATEKAEAAGLDALSKLHWQTLADEFDAIVRRIDREGAEP